MIEINGRDKAIILKRLLSVVSGVFALPFTLLFLFWLFIFVLNAFKYIMDIGYFFQTDNLIAGILTFLGVYSLGSLWWVIFAYNKSGLSLVPLFVRIGLGVGVIGNFILVLMSANSQYVKVDLIDWVFGFSTMIALIIGLVGINIKVIKNGD